MARELTTTKKDDAPEFLSTQPHCHAPPRGKRQNMKASMTQKFRHYRIDPPAMLASKFLALVWPLWQLALSIRSRQASSSRITRFPDRPPTKSSGLTVRVKHGQNRLGRNASLNYSMGLPQTFDFLCSM